MVTSENGKMLARVRRISGQIKGVERMVGEQQYCLDILNQIAAVRSALDALGVKLLTRHVETCVAGRGGEGTHPKARRMSRDKLLAEVSKALRRFLR